MALFTTLGSGTGEGMNVDDGVSQIDDGWCDVDAGIWVYKYGYTSIHNVMICIQKKSWSYMKVEWHVESDTTWYPDGIMVLSLYK